MSGEEITANMFLSALHAFLEDYAEKPETLFEEMEIMQYPTH